MVGHMNSHCIHSPLSIYNAFNWYCIVAKKKMGNLVDIYINKIESLFIQNVLAIGSSNVILCPQF